MICQDYGLNRTDKLQKDSVVPYNAEICSHPGRVRVSPEVAAELHVDVNETDDLRDLSRFDDLWEDGLFERMV